LGYNAANAAGVGPSQGTVTCTKATLAEGVGTPVYSSYQLTTTSTDSANPLAFNEASGFDPFSCNKVVSYDVTSVGVEPVVFVHGQENDLAGLTNATEFQLQQVFSGTNTDASAFGLTPTNTSINAYLREPLSGTMNTAEANVFRHVTGYSSTAGHGWSVEGLSQETGVGTPTAGTTSNPLQLASAGSGKGYRWRGIGTSEIIKEVQQSSDGSSGVYPNSNHVDGIGYTFFSYANVSPLADSTKYGYITLNGVDPIFASWNQGSNGAGGNIDPGQPVAANGTIPGNADISGGLPACENQIWGNDYSFPNVRNGSYRAWSILRLAYATTQATVISDLVKSSNNYAVSSVPDYIPLAKVTITGSATSNCGTTTFVDPGVDLVRSHYQQRDGADDALGKAPVNTGTTEAGGDMGGAILFVQTTTPNQFGYSDTLTQYVLSGSQTNGNLSSAVRPNN
jgi:hypothetical protein